MFIYVDILNCIILMNEIYYRLEVWVTNRMKDQTGKWCVHFLSYCYEMSCQQECIIKIQWITGPTMQESDMPGFWLVKAGMSEIWIITKQ